MNHIEISTSTEHKSFDELIYPKKYISCNLNHINSFNTSKRIDACAVCRKGSANHWAHDDVRDDQDNDFTILPVVELPVHSHAHGVTPALSLLDNGSTSTLISYKSIHKYAHFVVHPNVEMDLTGASGQITCATKTIRCFVPNVRRDKHLFHIDATILPDLPSHCFLMKPFNPFNLPIHKLNGYSNFPRHYTHFDFIIGVTDMYNICLSKPTLYKPGCMAQPTRFGIVCSGNLSAGEQHDVDTNQLETEIITCNSTEPKSTSVRYNKHNQVRLSAQCFSITDDVIPKNFDYLCNNTQLSTRVDPSTRNFQSIDHYVQDTYQRSLNLPYLEKEDLVNFLHQNVGELQTNAITATPPPRLYDFFCYNTSRILSDLAIVAELLAKQEEVEKLDTAEQSTADQFAAKQMLEKTLTYDPKLKIFETDLLIRPGSILENNYFHTLSRFIASEKKALATPAAREIYVTEFRKFITLEVVEEVFDNTPHLGDYKHYLPTTIVSKPESTSTPWRVCLDAGATHKKDSKSLNDCIFDTPPINNNLIAVELNARWRQFLILSDIRKLYLQIRMRPTSRNLLRYLWRDPDEKGGKIKIFQFTRCIWGVKDSGFIAMAAVEQLFRMRKEGLVKEFPTKSKQDIEKLKRQLDYTQSCFYVDDFILSADSVEEILFLFKLVQDTLALGSLKLCKISSNSAKILETFPSELKEEVIDFYVQNKNPPRLNYPIKISANCSILGYQFCPAEDTYVFSKYADLHEKFKLPMRKIDLASLMPRFYDNLNFLGPWKFLLKRAMRHATLAKLDWKDSLEALQQHEIADIKDFLTDIPLIKDLSFPRWVQGQKDSVILIFSDASKKGIAYCSYVVSKTSKGYVSHLLETACDIAPLKATRAEQDSCPKLELCAAKLAIKHATLLVDSLCDKYGWGLKKEQFYCLTDSSVVLAWLNQVDTNKQTIYVRERVNFIKKLGLKWYHVTTEHNMADCCSRGSRIKLLFTPFYQNGQPWMRADPSTYPIRTDVSLPFVDDKEGYKVLEGIQKRYIMAFMSQEMRVPEKIKTVISYYLNLCDVSCPAEDDLEYQYLTIDCNNIISYDIGRLFRPKEYFSSFKQMKRVGAAVLFAADKFKSLLLLKHAGVSKAKRRKNMLGAVCRTKVSQNGKFDIPFDLVPIEFYKQAELMILKQDQHLHFAKEIRNLKANRNVPLRSSIREFSPYLDENDMLRANSRLAHYPDSFVSPDTKHQIILPDSELVEMFVLYDHLRENHPAREAHKQTLLEKYIIVKQNSVVENASKACVKCSAVNAVARNQTSGFSLHKNITLSEDVPSRLFRFTGVDCSGPIQLCTMDKGSFNVIKTQKVDRRRTRAQQAKYIIQKEFAGGIEPHIYTASIVIFVCLESGAIHLELTSNLKTNSYLFALKRFMHRHSVPLCFCSDNAGIFKKSDKILRHSATEINKLAKTARNLEVNWEYSLPFQSHTAGLWERNFRTVKENLQKLSTVRPMTFEQMLTLLYIIADNINDIPKFPDEWKKKHNLKAVCPNDLIKGHKGGTIPLIPHKISPDVINDDSIIQSFKQIEELRESVMKDFAKAFLLRRSKRQKWNREEKPFNVGDIVKVRNIHSKRKFSRLNLPSAVITEILPGRDGVTRSYKIDYGSNFQPSRRLKNENTEIRPHRDLYLITPRKEEQANHVEFVSNFFRSLA